MTQRYEEITYRVGSGSSNIHRISESDDSELFGAVTTPHGIVEVWTWEGGPCSDARLVHDGTVYVRWTGRFMTELALTRFAAKLARDVVSGEFGKDDA